jgi:hypothetical protein
MNGLFLFVVSCLIGGAAAVLGSILGNAAGTTGLFGGAILGGLAGAVASTALARRFQWIRPEAARSARRTHASSRLTAVRDRSSM